MRHEPPFTERDRVSEELNENLGAEKVDWDEVRRLTKELNELDKRGLS